MLFRSDSCHHQRMNWWQTLIVAVVPVGITTAALLVQQILLDRRAAREADHARLDHKVERLERAHTEMLEALLEVWRKVERPLNRASLDYMHGGQPRFTPADVRTPDLRPVDVALSRLAIIEHSDMVKLAERCVRSIIEAHGFMQEVYGGAFTYDEQRLLEATTSVETTRAEYSAEASASLRAART